MTLVMKFGGTSVGSGQAIRRTADLIQHAQAEWGRVVVVASGMGSKPVKVTDLLLEGANTAIAGDGETYKKVGQQLREIHFTAIDELLEEAERPFVRASIEPFIAHFEALCQAVHVLGELTPRALDTIGGMGEQMSVRILAAYLRQQGVPAEAIDATELIVTDAHFQNATPLLDKTTEKVQERLQPLFDADTIPIITGFIGATEEGLTTTLGRGGSDYSASILGQAVRAEEVWIWTDVDGVMTADPRLVPSAQTIPALTYREVSELAYYGAKVLHPKTMRPCVENDIPLRIKNTFNPDHAGTVVTRTSPYKNGGVKAVTAIPALALITVEGRGMIGVQGIAARTFSAVASTNVNVLLISQASSEQSICFAIQESAAEAVIANLEKEFADELQTRDIEKVWAIRPVAIVTAVGSGMRGTPGVAGRIFTQLGNSQVNSIAIAQGSSECSISLVVDGNDRDKAVQLLHGLVALPVTTNG